MRAFQKKLYLRTFSEIISNASFLRSHCRFASWALCRAAKARLYLAHFDDSLVAAKERRKLPTSCAPLNSSFSCRHVATKGFTVSDYSKQNGSNTSSSTGYKLHFCLNFAKLRLHIGFRKLFSSFCSSRLKTGRNKCDGQYNLPAFLMEEKEHFFRLRVSYIRQ